MSTEHGGGHGGAGPIVESDVPFADAFMSFFEAIFLITLIKVGTGNPQHNRAHGGGHGGGH